MLKQYTLGNFVMVHNGSHNIIKIYCSFSFNGHVNRCELLNSNISSFESLKNNVTNRLKAVSVVSFQILMHSNGEDGQLIYN